MQAFTEKQLNAMFYVVDKKGKRIRVKKEKKQKVSSRARLAFDDTIVAGITSKPPGKGRVADLARFYDENAAREGSPFSF